MEKSVKEKQKKSFDSLKSKFGYSNIMQAPRLVKVVISSGIGKISDKKKKELIGNRLTQIAGQKVSSRKAKQSIASFKVRAGDEVGYQVTLRGDRMFDFVDKLINLALPRTKDFRGLNAKAIDDMGNVTFGVREHTIFPETSDEDVRDIFGLAITVVTTAKTKSETEEFLRMIGFPWARAKEGAAK